MNRTEEPKGINDKCFSLVKYKAYSFSLSTNVPMDELVSEGMLIYAECLLKYDPSKGVRFSTFLYRVLDTRLTNFVGEYYKQMPLISEWIDAPLKYGYNDDGDSVNEDAREYLICHDNFAQKLQFHDSIKSLSPEAQGVIEILNICANEIIGMCSDKITSPHAQRNLIGSLRKYLKKLGWRPSTIEHTFDELRLAVKSF